MAAKIFNFSLEDFYHSAELFLTSLQSQILNADLKLEPHWDIDHICYRVESETEYRQMNDFLSGLGKLLVEAPVSGRPISTFELNSPILFMDREIHLLELPAPKKGKAVASGFEHIEVVVDIPLQDLPEQCPHLDWKKTGMTKHYNAEIAVMFDEASIKFHHYSLKSVVQLEKQSKTYEALLSTRLLEKFATNFPLVVGTIPLEVSTSHSDLDIVFESENISSTLAQLTQKFSGEASWSSSNEVATFRFQQAGVFFEVYISQAPTTQQRAFRHYQAEERLLKYGGLNLKNKIKELRARGFKTEPAFAKALALSGDPFEAIEKVQKLDHIKLRSLLERTQNGTHPCEEFCLSLL